MRCSKHLYIYKTSVSTADISRMSTTCVSGNYQCGDGFPSDFCCPERTTCLPLAQDKEAVLCCPGGQDCSTIAPITCDTALWNPATSPYSNAHSNISLFLTPCADACCPPPYECKSSVRVKATTNFLAANETTDSALRHPHTLRHTHRILPW